MNLEGLNDPQILCKIEILSTEGRHRAIGVLSDRRYPHEEEVEIKVNHVLYIHFLDGLFSLHDRIIFARDNSRCLEDILLKQLDTLEAARHYITNILS